MFSLFKIKAVSNKSHKILDIAKIMQIKTHIWRFFKISFLYLSEGSINTLVKKTGFLQG